MKIGEVGRKEILIFLSLVFFVLIAGDISASSVNITYPLNNTNYTQSIPSLNYSVSGSDLHSCWYSNSSGAWNSSAVLAGTNFSISAAQGGNSWSVYCSELYADDGSFPTFPDTESSGVNLYSFNFTINGVSASIGDKIAAYDPDGVAAGVFTVIHAGIYGFMPVYRSDGTVITFTVLDNSTNLVYNVTKNYTVSGAAMQFPTVNFPPGDVNCSDCNKSSDSVIFNVDTTPPVLIVVFPITTNYSINVSELNYTFMETNPGKCWYSRDSGATNETEVDCGINFTEVISAEGSNTWILYMNDTFGNQNSTNMTFFKDTVYPLISFGTGTENTGTNFSRNWIYVNTSWTETNLKNITFYLYNDTSIVNSTTYITAIYLINFTNLIDNNYSYEVNITDIANNRNSTGIRTITIDDTPPTVNIDFPLDGATYFFNNISMNYTVSDNLVGLSSCWYTNDSGSHNYSTTCNQNFTQNLSEGTYTYIIYANDTLNNIGNRSYTFEVSTTAPAVILNFPLDNQWFNNDSNFYFNFTATDSDGLDTCELWGNWTGTWHKNYTWTYPTNATMNFTIINLTEGSYIWNVWCNDTSNNGDFSALNKTVNMDITYPLISYDAETSADGANLSQSSVYVNVIFTETNFANITFNLANDTTIIHSNVYLTVTYEINWTSVADGNYTYYINITDKANNKNSTSIRRINLDTVPPSLAVVYPDNTTYSLNVSALNYTTNGVSCWWSNNSGAWNSTPVSAGINWTNLVSIEGSNTWTVYCNDSANNINSSSITFFKDTIYPIFLNYSDNSGTLNNSGIASFNVTIENTNGTVFLQIDNTNYTVSNPTVNMYSISVSLFSAGNYNYTWNSWGNETIHNHNISDTLSYIVNGFCGDGICDVDESCSSCPGDCGACSVTPSSGGRGGGGGTITGLTYTLNDDQFKEGCSKELPKGDKMKFKVNNDTHYVAVNEVVSNYITINVTSKLQQATLYVGDERKFDLTEDGLYDLSVKLNSINATSLKADLTIKSISGEVVAEPTIIEEASDNPSEVISESNSEVKSIKENKLWIIIIIVALIIAGVILFFIFHKKYRKRKHK